MSSGPGPGELCHVLREDPDLADALPAARREQAIEELTTRVVHLGTGPWAAPREPSDAGIGMLVLGGVLLRRVGVEGRHGAELLGECDVLRPWQRRESNGATLRLLAGWTVLEPSRLAVLDEEFERRLVRYPELAGRLVARALNRARTLAVNMAIVQQARVDVRLHMLLWYLAGRWGRVRSDGTVLPVRLTHTALADLVAARRPTVTSALSELSRRGSIRFVSEGWLLDGEAPQELLDLGARYPRAET